MFALFMLGGDFKFRFAKLFLHPGTRILVVGVVAFVSLAVILPRMTKATLDTPQILSYQGRLTDAQKVTIADGSQSMKFAVYDASVAGTCLWSAGDDIGDGVDTTFSAGSDCPANVPSTAVSVSVTDGLFQVLLGASPQNAFPDSLFNTTAGQERWLEIRIGAETLSPRRRLGSSPSALQAGNASLLDGMDTSQVGGSVAFVPVTDSSGNLTLTKNLTIDTNTLFVDSANNRVGVGTVTPGGRLQLDTTEGGDDVLRLRDTTIGSNATFSFSAPIGIGPDLNITANRLILNTYALRLYRIEGSGSGILMEVGNAPYSITGATDIVLQTNSANTQVFRGGNAIATTIRGYSDSYAVVLQPSGGNVGIGTASPGTILDVRGNVTVLSGSDFRPTADAVNALNIANAAGTDFVSFDTTNGRVGIGSGAPGAWLDIAAAENTERLRLTDTTNADSIGQYVGVGTPEGFVTAQLGSIYFDSGGAAYLKTSGDNTNTGWQQITAGGSGANTSLSNLTTTSINQNLLPDSDDVRDLGSPSLRWQNLYLGPTTLHIVSTAAETTTARDWKLSVQETNGATEGNLRLMEGASEFVSVTPAGDVGIGSTAPGAKLDVQAGTMTTDVYPLLIGGTWNNSGVAFTGLKVNMTDTASDATSKLLDLQVGGSSKFSVTKDGSFSATGKFTVGTTAGPGDPTGVNGDVVYNIALGKLRCYENGSWTNCVTAAGSAGGWTDFGSYIDLDTASDNVGIGIVGAPAAKLEVNGAVRMYGGQMDLNTTGSGITNIGTGSSTGAILIGNVGNTLSVGTSVLSQTTNSFALGSDSKNFSMLFLGANGIVFEGSVDNAFETTLNVGEPTADRTINFPNASGNVLLDSNTALFTLAGSSGSSQSIGFGDTLSILAGSNISSIASATDTVTIAVASSPTFTSVISPSYTGSGAVSVLSGSTNSLTLDTSSASGSVLIGTTSAGALTIGRSAIVTTVNGTLTANTFTSSGATISGGSVNGTPIGNSTPSTGVFSTLSTTGNATIGDVTTDRLTVAGEFVLGSITSDPTGTNGMMFYNSTANKFRCYENSAWGDCISSGTGGGWTDDGAIVRLTTGTDQVRIGTTAVGNSQALEVNGVIRSITGGFQFPDGTTQTTAAATSSGVSSTGDINISSNTDNSAGGDTIISTSTSERMRITSAGNVGIGTGGPGARLEVAGTFTAAGGAINLNQNSNNNFNLCTGGGCNGTMAIGNVDAGDGGTPTLIITTPGWTIDTVGNASGFGTITADGLISGSAGITISSGAVTLNPSSTPAINIGQNTTYNGAITIGNNDPGDGGTPTVTITGGPAWSISAGGLFSTTSTITSSGLITSNNGITTNTGAVNLLPTGTAAINLGSNTTYNGAITIGNTDAGDGGTPTVIVTSPGWTIDTVGNASGFGTFGGDGLMTLSAGFTMNGGAFNLTASGTPAINLGTNGTYNGTITIGNVDAGDGGTPTIVITSPGWTIDGSGNASGFGTIGADGRITGTAGLSISGQTVELNRNSNFSTLICDLGNCNGTVTIGNNDSGDGGTPLVNITSAGNWSITNGGTFNTVSTITSSGLITGNNGITTNTGAVNLLPTGVAAINLGSNTTYNGTITIGNTDTGDGGSPTLNLRATDMSLSGDAQWSISAGGAISTSGNIAGSGGLDVTSGVVRIRGVAETTGIRLGTNTSFDDPVVIGNSDTGSGGSPALTIDTVGWSVSSVGNMSGIGSISADGLITGTAGLTISGAAINLNTATNAAFNLCTADACDGALVIGNNSTGSGGAPTLSLVGGTGWSIGTTGTFANSAGATVTSSGRITSTGGLTISGGTIALNDATNSAITICTGDTCDATVSIGNNNTGSGGAPLVNLTSAGNWSITNGGTFNTVSTITSSGLITGNNGLTINTGAVNLLPTGVAAINLGSNTTYNGAITIGNTDAGDGGTPTVAITSPGWTIDTAGNASGFGTFGGDGLMTLSAGFTMNGGAFNLTTTGTPAINLGTSTSYNGVITIGNTDGGDGGTPTISITAPEMSLTGDAEWSITTGGVISSTIPASAFTERLCWDASGISTIADCTGTPGDYAEMYGTSDRHVEAGDIVMLDASRNAVPVIDENGVSTSKAYVLKSDKANSPLVFGIVATAPNETIGQAIPADELPRPIALSGRVPVKVNEENGRIHIGDPITSSSVPGVGMKATQNGMIVGFALSASTGEPNETIIVSVHTGWWNGAALVVSNAASGISAPTVSTFTITNDTDYALYSIYNIRSIRGMNWSISEQGDAVLHTIATQQLTITKTSDMATIGEGVMKLGEQSLTIMNAAMEPTSKVFLSWRGNPGSFAMITNRAAGSFTIGLVEPATADAEFDYWIVAVNDQAPTAPVVVPSVSEPVVVPAETTTLTEPATTTTLTEPATTTTLTAPAEIIVPTSPTSSSVTPSPEVPTTVESVPVDSVPVSEAAPETTVLP